MSEVYQDFIAELLNEVETDRLYKTAFKKAGSLEVFKGEAVSFYLGMFEFLKNYLEFNKKFESYSTFVNDCFNNNSNQELLRFNFEEKAISKLSRLEKQQLYLNLSLIFQYSIVLESAINRDVVIKNHPEKKHHYLRLGFHYKNTGSTWIELISIASNFARHSSEWRLILEAKKRDEDNFITINEIIKDKERSQNFLKLFELSSIKDSFKSSTRILDLSNSIIKDLDLLNLERSFKRIEIWLRRLETKWADQYYLNNE